MKWGQVPNGSGDGQSSEFHAEIKSVNEYHTGTR